MLPEELPLPRGEIMGRSLACAAHLVHFVCRWNLVQPSSSTWDDYIEDETSWFSWVGFILQQ
jgi:hypothetical protein